ncbi:MAG: 4Fe-4S binding protein [bacterium]
MPQIFKRRIENRNQHMIFFTSMVILFLTGYFKSIPKSWINYLGDSRLFWSQISGILHRIAAFAFIASSLYHLKFLFVSSDGRSNFKNLIFTKQDLVDFWIHLLSSLHLTKKKLVRKRFYYNEKCDYWIVFQGTIAFIITGTILWLEEYFGKFIIDISYIIHNKEALWGVYTIIVWHFFNLHPEFYLYAREDAQPCGRDECVFCGICDLLTQDKDSLNAFLSGDKQVDSLTKTYTLNLCIGDVLTRANKLKEKGITTCKEGAAALASDATVCQYGCIGLGDCVAVCRTHARYFDSSGRGMINNSLCTGCEECIRVCPRNLIIMYPKEKRVHIPCRSLDKGTKVREVCAVGCLGCGICVKFCPVQAITLENNLARLDYEKCIECGICAAKCPHKTIVDLAGPRAKVKIETSGCTGCSECVKVCPVKAIQPDAENAGKFKVLEDKCIGCKICIDKCPPKCIKIVNS